MDTTIKANGAANEDVPTEEVIELDAEMVKEFTAFLEAKRQMQMQATSAPSLPHRAVAPLPPHRAIVRPQATGAELEVIERRILKDKNRGIGLVGRAKVKLFGDPLQKDQLDDLNRRVKAMAPRQRAELAGDLVTGLRDAGLAKVVTAINNMAVQVGSYEPDSDAAEVGRRMIDRNKEILPELENLISENAERMIIEELGFDR